MKNFHDKDEINLKNSKERDRMYSRFDGEQRDLFQAIKDHVFTFCEATAGSGKTLCSVAAMIDMLANGEIDKLVYVRVIDDRSMKAGFLPGDLDDKSSIYWGPLYDAMEMLGFTPYEVEAMENTGLIVKTLDISLRGTNLTRAGVIVDEVQNINVDTLRLIFTRCHDDVHCIAIGDGRQNDNDYVTDEFRGYCDYLANSSIGCKVTLRNNYRGHFSRLAEEYQP